ncbi:hypothetical protein IAU60_006128 [Kwoniella sp. DSM 27419]
MPLATVIAHPDQNGKLQLRLLKMIQDEEMYREAFFPQGISITKNNWALQRACCMEFLENDQWMRDKKQEGLVVWKDGEWHPTAKWTPQSYNPVAKRVALLKRYMNEGWYKKHFGVLPAWSSMSDIPRQIKDKETRKKYHDFQDKHPYYFLLRELWLRTQTRGQVRLPSPAVETPSARIQQSLNTPANLRPSTSKRSRKRSISTLSSESFSTPLTSEPVSKRSRMSVASAIFVQETVTRLKQEDKPSVPSARQAAGARGSGVDEAIIIDSDEEDGQATPDGACRVSAVNRGLDPPQAADVEVKVDPALLERRKRQSAESAVQPQGLELGLRHVTETDLDVNGEKQSHGNESSDDSNTSMADDQGVDDADSGSDEDGDHTDTSSDSSKLGDGRTDQSHKADDNRHTKEGDEQNGEMVNQKGVRTGTKPDKARSRGKIDVRAIVQVDGRGVQRVDQSGVKSNDQPGSERMSDSSERCDAKGEGRGISSGGERRIRSPTISSEGDGEEEIDERDNENDDETHTRISDDNGTGQINDQDEFELNDDPSDLLHPYEPETKWEKRRMRSILLAWSKAESIPSSCHSLRSRKPKLQYPVQSPIGFPMSLHDMWKYFRGGNVSNRMLMSTVLEDLKRYPEGYELIQMRSRLELGIHTIATMIERRVTRGDHSYRTIFSNKRVFVPRYLDKDPVARKIVRLLQSTGA